MRLRYLLLLSFGGIFTLCSLAWAVTGSLNVSVAFQRNLAIEKIRDMDFGTLIAGRSAVYRVDIAGNVSTSGAGMFLHGPTSPGEARISGSTTQAIDITSDNYTVDEGVEILGLRCVYDNQLERNCDVLNNRAAPGSGKSLLIAGRIFVDGTQVAGTVAKPTFDMVVMYH